MEQQQQLSKAERNRIAVAKHGAKIGIEKNREVSKQYMRKYRSNPDIKQKELDAEKGRNKKNYDALKMIKQENRASITLQSAVRNKLARNAIYDLRIDRDFNNIRSLSNSSPVNSFVDTKLNDVFQNVINSVSDKYGRGRPLLHFEERHKRELEKEQKKLNPKPRGRPKKKYLIEDVLFF